MRLTAEELGGYLKDLPEDAHNELRGVIRSYLLLREQGVLIPKIDPQGQGYGGRVCRNGCIVLASDRLTIPEHLVSSLDHILEPEGGN